MMGTALLLIVGLIVFFGVLVFAATSESRGGRPPMQTKSLREIESMLLEIQNTSNDVYARGKASECANKVRKVLDGD